MNCHIIVYCQAVYLCLVYCTNGYCMDVTVADKQSLWLYCDHIISHASDHRILFCSLHEHIDLCCLCLTITTMITEEPWMFLFRADPVLGFIASALYDMWVSCKLCVSDVDLSTCQLRLANTLKFKGRLCLCVRIGTCADILQTHSCLHMISVSTLLYTSQSARLSAEICGAISWTSWKWISKVNQSIRW